MTFNKTLLVIALQACCLLGFGCWGSTVELPELVPVSGVVTLNGKPLPNASIAFHPLESGSSSYGRTDENGKYSLMFSGQNTGAIKGTHRVEIRTREEIVDKDGNLVSDQPEILPPQYNDQSKLSTDVIEGQETVNFDLKSRQG